MGWTRLDYLTVELRNGLYGTYFVLYCGITSPRDSALSMSLWLVNWAALFLLPSYAVIAYGCASCPKLTCEREGCQTEFCYHCKQIWHPNQTCDMARQQRAQSLRVRTKHTSGLSYGQESGPGTYLRAPGSLLLWRSSERWSRESDVVRHLQQP